MRNGCATGLIVIVIYLPHTTAAVLNFISPSSFRDLLATCSPYFFRPPGADRPASPTAHARERSVPPPDPTPGFSRAARRCLLHPCRCGPDTRCPAYRLQKEFSLSGARR